MCVCGRGSHACLHGALFMCVNNAFQSLHILLMFLSPPPACFPYISPCISSYELFRLFNFCLQKTGS